MRGMGPVVAVALVAGPLAARAESWKDIVPGTSPLSKIIEKFGEPSKRVKKGERKVLSYQGERAIKGARQANFYVSKADVVEEIHVFPKAVVPVDAIENTYGKDFVRRVTDDFRTYYFYERKGLVVFLNEDAKTVYSVIYTAPDAPPGGG